MRSSNPVLKRLTNEEQIDLTYRMSVEGTINKVFILFMIVMGSAFVLWSRYMEGGVDAIGSWMIIGLIGGLISALLTSFIPRIAVIAAPIYAVFEGMALGGLSAMYEQRYQGITIQAVGLTFGVFLVMIMIYRFRIINVNAKFRKMVVGATLGVLLVYIIDLIMSFFGSQLTFIHDSSPLSIFISLFVVGIAAFNFVLDFDMIEQGSKMGLPKYMEWYGAFSLIVTLVWLYVEILDLLRKLKR
ncbi:Bax inhibitor-1/YccA family protein [Tepidibacillus fermentans]|uniref:Putative YccA/Bax inhibitor family protein n=1 Tax=Tepidibacillus fermentans TaxID=1281767 RepID=A0A4R3KKP5_9BACI|nr:Bax inhibitor-1/YccA family protein [Tepidibacillus fermentans]TCS84374.1 putative YccA/Bax inhibitor family protein [Tepidibacillus fermentans]